MLGSEFGAKAPGPAGCYGWRVKLYQLESEGAGAWQDQGTGNVSCKSVLSGPAIVVMNESEDEEFAPLLQSKIQIEDVYERQGESIIMWRESDYAGDVDYALSFQDTAGCHAIWEAIGDVQSQYNQQREYGVTPSFSSVTSIAGGDDTFGGVGSGQSPLLPTVTAGNLQEIRDKLFSAHSHPSSSLREGYIVLVLERGADFFHRLITIYSDMEDLEDKEGLIRIAEICRAILFLNDPGILEYVLTDNVFVHIAGALEYDPALKSRGEYREFLSSRARQIEVIPMESVTLRQAITLLFRLKYLRDVMLRPTIEDTGVSALNSMIAFATSDICTKVFEDLPYVARILKIINPGIDISSLVPPSRTEMGPQIGPNMPEGNQSTDSHHPNHEGSVDPELPLNATNGKTSDSDAGITESSSRSTNGNSSSSSEGCHGDVGYSGTDNQGGLSSAAVQSEETDDGSRVGDVEREKQRAADAAHRFNAVRFLRELFYLTRSLSIDRRSELFNRLLQRLGTQLYQTLQHVLSFSPEGGTSSERILVSETLACIAIACPSSLRQYILDGPIPSLPRHLSASRPSNPATGLGVTNPSSSLGLISIGTMGGTGLGAVCTENNNMSFLYVIIRRVVCDCDTAVIEQLGDTVKVLLDPERLVDRLDKDRFLGIFYDYYIHWLITPFVEPNRPDRHGQEPEHVDDNSSEEEKEKEKEKGRSSGSAGAGVGVGADRIKKAKVKQQSLSAVSTSRRFLLDIFSLCVHGHTYRMKYFIMRNSVIARTLRILESPHRQLHVGAVKFVRTVLATKDEFYHRHIVKLDLLRPVLEALTSSAKKDNLISSAIAELVEYVRTENVRTLADYIVEKHSACFKGAHRELLERLMIRYEQGKDRDRDRMSGYEVPEETGGGFPGPNDGFNKGNGLGLTRQAVPSARNRRLSALSDNNREKEHEDSYFFSDDDEDDDNNSTDSNSSSGSVNDNVGPGGSIGGMNSSGGFISAGGGFGEYERFVREGSSFSDYGRDRERDRERDRNRDRENMILERHLGHHPNHSTLPTDPDIDDKIATSLPSSSSSSHLSSLPFQSPSSQWASTVSNGTPTISRYDFSPTAKASLADGQRVESNNTDSLSLLQCYAEEGEGEGEVDLGSDSVKSADTPRPQGNGGQNSQRMSPVKVKSSGPSRHFKGNHRGVGKSSGGREERGGKGSDDEEPPPLPPLRSKYETAEDDSAPDLKGYFRRTVGLRTGRKESSSKMMVIGKLKCVGADFSSAEDLELDPRSLSVAVSVNPLRDGEWTSQQSNPNCSSDASLLSMSGAAASSALAGGGGGVGVGGVSEGDAEHSVFSTPATPTSLIEEGVSDSDMDSGNESGASGASAATGGTGGSDIDSDFDTAERTKHYPHAHPHTHIQSRHTYYPHHPPLGPGPLGVSGHSLFHALSEEVPGVSGSRKRDRDREHTGGQRRVRVGGHVSDVDSDSDLPSYPLYSSSSSSSHHNDDGISGSRIRGAPLQATSSTSSSVPYPPVSTSSCGIPLRPSVMATAIAVSGSSADEISVTASVKAGDIVNRETEGLQGVEQRDEEREKENDRIGKLLSDDDGKAVG